VRCHGTAPLAFVVWGIVLTLGGCINVTSLTPVGSEASYFDPGSWDGHLECHTSIGTYQMRIAVTEHLLATLPRSRSDITQAVRLA
jgi:hypothetical protein